MEKTLGESEKGLVDWEYLEKYSKNESMKSRDLNRFLVSRRGVRKKFYRKKVSKNGRTK